MNKLNRIHETQKIAKPFFENHFSRDNQLVEDLVQDVIVDSLDIENDFLSSDYKTYEEWIIAFCQKRLEQINEIHSVELVNSENEINKLPIRFQESLD